MKQFFALLFLAAFSFCVSSNDDVKPPNTSQSESSCRWDLYSVPCDQFLARSENNQSLNSYQSVTSCSIESITFVSQNPNGSEKYDYRISCEIHDSQWNRDEIRTDVYHATKFYELTYSCPHPDFPDYTYPVDSNADGDTDYCIRDPNLCQRGYFKFKIDGQCVPIECDSAGTQKSFWAKTSLINSNEGIYCDGKCSYKISPDSAGFQGLSGHSAISGVSTGAVCGRGPGEDWFQQNPLDSDCQTETTTAGNQFISCNDVYGHDPETGATDNIEPPNAKLDDTVTMTDQKVDKAQIHDYDPSTANLENCDPTDTACAARNVVPALVDLERYRQEQETDRHNKAIEAKEKEAGYLVEAINNLRESNAANAKYLAEHSGGGSHSEVNVDLDGLIDSASVPDGTGIQGALDGAGSGVNAAIDGLMNGDGYEQFTLTASDVDYVDKLIAKLQLTGQCQMSWELWGHSINFDYCEASERLRPLVNFFVYFTTIFTIFYRVTGSLKLRSA